MSNIISDERLTHILAADVASSKGQAFIGHPTYEERIAIIDELIARRAADEQAVRPICVRQAIANMENHDYCDSINVAYKYGWNDAIKSAGGTIEE